MQPVALARQCGHDLGHPRAPKLGGSLTELCSHNLGHLSAPVTGVLPVQPGALTGQCGHDLSHPSAPLLCGALSELCVITRVTFLPLLQESYLCSLERWLDSVVMTWVKTIFFSPQQVVAKSSKLTFQLPEVNPDVTEYRLDKSLQNFFYY